MGLFNKKEENKQKDFYLASGNYKETLGQKLKKLFGGKILNEQDFIQLEEILISADIGPIITNDILNKLKQKNISDIEKGIEFLKIELQKYLIDKYPAIERGELNIMLVLGVNGVGKTTSIAKLANYYNSRKWKVLIAAADTFRAAATEQITKWANQLNIPIIKQGHGADPASVVFDAIDSAKAKNIDLLIIDTAGRLHTKQNLMDELKKIDRIIKNKGNFNRMNLLVLDCSMGQNAYVQAESFKKDIGVDGIMLAKYDTQAKGGIVFTIQKKLEIPIYFIGTGEKIENIEVFNKEKFVEKIFN